MVKFKLVLIALLFTCAASAQVNFRLVDINAPVPATFVDSCQCFMQVRMQSDTTILKEQIETAKAAVKEFNYIFINSGSLTVKARLLFWEKRLNDLQYHIDNL